ncbi:undecaprenyl-phosphate glucose phosphotransferase [Reinekea marinisedimentorum]|uniref:Putative colanic acid biosynthesis UDP-glucose lipid carrier transferase n=1 Tax=Reinekea marinisedimentorum TaxID=230495 RepID=A0A4R3I7C9_9GAMM|nr:undecaprenyl-phosphate glucose phosphotransferase [Reinekea marinisedimentorum]TCS41927.1 putative colanic acid biosynthesis UDP-glucose lipid carrier transferase [Reinekea marinisedimentorum]
MLSLFMRVADVALLFAAFWIGYIWVYGFVVLQMKFVVALFVATLLLVLIFQSAGMYRAWRGATKTREVGRALGAVTTIFGLLALISVALKVSADYSRMWLGLWYLCSLAFICIYRYLVRKTLDRLRKRGYNVKKIALLGDGSSLYRAIKELELSPWLGLKPSFYYVTDVTDTDKKKTHGINPEAAEWLVQQVVSGELDEIWLALPISEAESLKNLLDTLSIAPCPIRYIPDFFGFDLINHSVAEVGSLPVVNLSVSPIFGWGEVLKWLEDKVLSLVFLILSSPVLLVLAIGVKLTSPGPVFYKQERVSWNGKRFNMLKFRSMPVDIEENGVKWGDAGSKTTTRFGSFIRKTSLDELPQFINVLKGDMSIVGPRPERTEFVEQFKSEIPRYMQKHMVKGGITGWAQVIGLRGDTDLHARIEADLYYIESWSIWLDIKILLLTAIKVFHDSSAK